MNRQKKALSDLAANILGNIAVVGAGLALYEQKWWCLIIASIPGCRFYYMEVKQMINIAVLVFVLAIGAVGYWATK